MSLCCPSWGDNEKKFVYLPFVELIINNPPTTVFNGEVVRIPMTLSYAHLQGKKVWSNHTKEGLNLENLNEFCPKIHGDVTNWHSHVCYMNIVVQGNGVGKIIRGYLSYHVSGRKKGNQF